MCTHFCAVRYIITGFGHEVFQYLSEILPLSQKQWIVTSDEVVSNNVFYYQQLLAFIGLSELLLKVSSAFKTNLTNFMRFTQSYRVYLETLSGMN